MFRGIRSCSKCSRDAHDDPMPTVQGRTAPPASRRSKSARLPVGCIERPAFPEGAPNCAAVGAGGGKRLRLRLQGAEAAVQDVSPRGRASEFRRSCWSR